MLRRIRLPFIIFSLGPPIPSGVRPCACGSKSSISTQGTGSQLLFLTFTMTGTVSPISPVIGSQWRVAVKLPIQFRAVTRLRNSIANKT